jgi:hypothetical protein
MVYIFDTSSMIVLSHYYPEGFPTFWQRFNKAVDNGTVVSVREVFNELENKTPKEWFAEWLKQHKSMFFTPTDDETKFIAEIFRVKHFQMLVSETQRLKGQPVADPFVIAAARIRKGTVITEEANKPDAAKIPNVCEHFKVSCTNLEGFLAANHWKF